MRAECALVACYWLMTSGKYLTMFVNSYRTVTDGQSPVDVAAELLPGVLVPDVSMRILNGIHAARSMLEGNPCIEVVSLRSAKILIRVVPPWSSALLDTLSSPAWLST